MAEESLATAIKARRERLGLTAEQFAEMVGLTQQAISKLENGSGCNGDTLARLQEYGGIRVSKKLIASLLRDAA